MIEWQQVAIGVVVGMTAWRILAHLVGSAMAVLLRDSRFGAWAVAKNKADVAEFNYRVERLKREMKP